MKVLYEEIYERPGNEAWLVDKIQIIEDDDEIYLRHKIKHTSSWAGNRNETNEIPLDGLSQEEIQKKVDKYMEENYLTSSMKNPTIKDIL